ncbi:MAG: endonuclease domain-containing protein [Clostridia bacterium]|nr:endonuclease domain-containing protein [Clostridia bacterium]
MPLNYNHKNIELAKNLRKNMTPQEKHLWYDYLAEYKPNFQRQKAIDNFIADFYCQKAKLIIEIDGAEHFTEDGKRRDDLRTEILEKYDLTVIRFSNFDIDKNFNTVCECIDKTVKARIEKNS